MPFKTSFVKFKINKIGLLTYFLSLILHLNFTIAEDYEFKIYDNKDGFSSPENLFALTDSRSFLWSAGIDGLTKYNGKTFTNFSKEHGLNDSQINCVIENNHGELICGTRKGVSIFDGKKFRNIGFKISGKSKKHEQHVRCLYISKQNELYAGTFNGLFKFNSKLNCFVRISNYNKLIRKINSDSFGNIFYSTKEGLFVVKKGLHFKVNISFKGEKQDITIIKQIKGNLYWAGTANGFLKLNYKNGIFQVLSKHGNDFINDIIKLKNGNFLFVGNMGIIYIISKNGLSKFNLSEIIFYVNIKSVAEDYQGNCWFATSLGLIKMFPSEVKKSDYTDKIKSAATSFVKGENNVIYFGTPNGLIKADGNRIEKFQLTNIPTDNFISATNYQNNQLLVGTITNKVFKFKNGRFELIFESQQQPTCIYKIINPTVNEYWIAASNDIVHLKNGKKQIYHISDQYTQDIYLDKSGKLWFANMASFGYIQKGKIHRLNTVFAKYNNFATISIDNNGAMWIGTYGSGMLRYWKGKIKAFNVKDGLTNNFVSSSFYDAKTNVLWVGTMYGVSKISLSKNSTISAISNHINGENIESYGCIQNAVCKLNNGKILFGVGEEIFEFSPIKQQLHNSQFKLLFSSIKVNEKEISWNDNNNSTTLYPIENKDQKTFRYDNNNFQFSFSSIDFHVPNQIEYSWQLIGYDKDWTSFSNHDFVSYTNLPSGDYCFKVRAINKTGQKSNIVSYYFTIKKPFYLEWWFILIASSFVILIAYLYTKSRIKKVKFIEAEKTENYKRLAEAELKSLRAQMNPHFMFNTLNAIQEIVLSGDEEKTRIYFADFAKMMRMILSNSTEKFISLEREIDFLKLYLKFEQIRFEGKFQLNLKIDPNLDLYSIKIPGMLLQPIIENAINHGLLHKQNNGVLDIQFFIKNENQEEYLHCIIQDNGIGIQSTNTVSGEKKDHRSMSTKITNERIEILNSLYGDNKYQLIISNLTYFETEMGTKVILIIKLN